MTSKITSKNDNTKIYRYSAPLFLKLASKRKALSKPQKQHEIVNVSRHCKNRKTGLLKINKPPFAYKWWFIYLRL